MQNTFSYINDIVAKTLEHLPELVAYSIQVYAFVANYSIEAIIVISLVYGPGRTI